MPATSAERTENGRARGKSPEAFRTISEVSEILDTPSHVLRFWESRFTQIKPVKRGGGRRYYRPQDISLLRGIRDLLYTEGLTIKGVQKILREQGVKHVAGLGEKLAGPKKEAEAPRPARAPRRKPADPQQGDLFGASETQRRTLRPADRATLRKVLTQLETLRDTMRTKHSGP